MVAFSQGIFDRICDRIADGESLRAICAESDMPSTASVMRWLAGDAALSEQYARAREMQGDYEFDKGREIVMAATPETVQVARLQYDALKWRAGKLRPKVYGDKMAIGGADDLPPIKTEDSGPSKLAAYLDAISSRAAGKPSE
jgi:hypothetical protein